MAGVGRIRVCGGNFKTGAAEPRGGGFSSGDAALVFSSGDTATRRWEALRDSRQAVHPMSVVVGSCNRLFTYP